MNSLTSFKRYQIAKVYRRDNPSKGRFREFYQCDFDIAGQYDKMGPAFEVEEKGLSPETADRIGGFVKERGSALELLCKLKQESNEFLKHEASPLALDEFDILFRALEKYKCIEKIVFDMSLARGLDYYTGVILEAVFKWTTQVGSIAAGGRGRYDNLIGMFGSRQIPAVGVSLGIERVFAIMEQNQKRPKVIRANETQVLVCVMEDDLTLAAELVSELWSAKIKAECILVKKVVKIFEHAEASGIPFAVMVRERELNPGIVQVRDVKDKAEEPIPRTRMIEELQNRSRNSS